MNPESPQLPPPPQLHPLAEPYSFMTQPFFTLTQWCIVICVLLIVGMVSYYFWKYCVRSSAAYTPLTPAQTAHRKIEYLKSLSPDLKTAATNLSLILREYITSHTDDPTLFETHQEFNRRSNVLQHLPRALQIHVRDLLQQMADYKYSAHVNNNTTIASAWIQETDQLISDIEEAKLSDAGYD